MPSSSSTSSTVKERQLLWHYKYSVARLHACGYIREAAVVATWYSDLLEKSSEQLEEWASADAEFCEDMAVDAEKQKGSANVAQVGNLTADVAAALVGVGRSEEADLFCERAGWMYEWSRRLEEYEWDDERCK